MNHRFKNTCSDSKQLLSGCNKLSTFMSRLEKQGVQNTNNWDPDTYKGDGFEALIEVLITASPIDKRINITNYRPWNTKIDGPDYGIDGLGFSHNGNQHTVQIKFRSNVTSILTANKDHISNFVASSSIKYGNTVDMTIFTTAKNLHEDVNHGMYDGKVRTLGYNDLCKLIDNNDAFWNLFRLEMGI